MDLESLLAGIVEVLASKEITITIDDARKLVNSNGFRNQKGQPYSSNRGFAQVLSQKYDNFIENGRPDLAKKLADNIVDATGNPAWKKK